MFTTEQRQALLTMSHEQRSVWLKANRMLAFANLYTNAELSGMVAEMGAVFIDNGGE